VTLRRASGIDRSSLRATDMGSRIAISSEEWDFCRHPLASQEVLARLLLKTEGATRAQAADAKRAAEQQQ
jgi:hypothetical protein